MAKPDSQLGIIVEVMLSTSARIGEVLIFAAELFAHAEHQDHHPAVHPTQRDGEPNAPTLSQAAPRKPDAT